MKVTRVDAMWCSGCLSMKKVWKEIEKKYPDLDIIKYDYDMDADEVSKLSVGTILPVIIFNKDGKELRLIGEKTVQEVIEVLENM